jgi:hypothetical protein
MNARRVRLNRSVLMLAGALALQGCAVIAAADVAATVVIGGVGLAADAVIGTARIAGKAVGATADALLPETAEPAP